MKKILILLLCITLALTTFITPVFGAEEVLPSESSDLLFMKSLGLMESNVTDESPVTRLQLANIYMKIALGNTISEESELPVPFTDCKKEDYAASFVNSCGIMRGVGEGLFAPDSNVTFNQLIKTAVTFLGYDDEAMYCGGYPSGYLTLATRLGIIKNGTVFGDSEITAHKVASVFKLMQNAPVRRRILFGGDGEWIHDDINYLTLYMGIERKRDVITATHATDIYAGKSFDYYDVIIDDTKYEAADGMKNIINYLGHRVDVYIDTENELLGKILYFEELQNNVFEISGRDITSVSGQTVSYYFDNTRVSQVTFAKNVFVIYNGTVCHSHSSQTINPFASSTLDGGIKLVDNNGDMVYDYIFVDAFDTFVVSKNIDGKIFNKYRPSEVIDLVGLENKDIEFTNIKGEPINLTYAAEGDILSVSKDLNGVPKKIVLTVDTYSGIVKEISYGSGVVPESINISGNTFMCAKSIASSTELEYLEPGVRITMFFNKNGEVAEISASDNITYSTGYVTDAGETVGVSSKIELRIFTPNGTFLIFPLASKIKTNNDVMVSDADFYSSLSKDSSGRIDRFMFAYNLNDNDEIDEIILPDLTGKTGPFYRYKEFDGASAVPSFKAYSFENRLLIDQVTTKIMVVPGDENRDNDDEYQIANTNNFFGDWGGYSAERPNPKFEAYGSVPGNPTAETILVKGSYSDDVIYNSSNVRLMVIDKITQITTEEGSKAYKLYGFFNGSSKSYVTDDIASVSNEISKILNSGDPKGDVVLLGYDSQNMVYSLSWLFDYSANAHTMTANPSNSSWSSSDRIIYGRVIYADDYAFTVEVETAPGIYATESFPTAKFTIIECNYRNNKNGVIAKKDKTRVFDAAKYPGNESYVIICTYNAQPKELVVINK